MWNARLDEAQVGIKIAGRNTNNLRYANDTTLMAESEEELKSLLMKVKVESEKVGLKLNMQKTKIMASGPVTSWQIDGETMETVTDCIFWGSKITADGDCSHEIKRCLLLWKKVMTNLDSILKSRDITLPTKVRLVKAIWFFQWSCMDVRVGLWRKLRTKESMLLNCGVGEDSWESLGLQGDPTSPFWRRSALGFLCSPRDSQESFPTPQFKSINSLALSFLYSPTLTSIRDYWKNQSFDYMDVCW